MGQVRRRRRAKRIREGAGDIPTSSFSDIAFLLIIYFLVVTTIVTTEGLVADMPAGQKSEDADTDEVPIVSVADGRVVFNDKSTTLQGLRASLVDLDLAEKTPEERVVMLEATGTTNYDIFYKTVAVIESSGGVIAMVRDADDGGGGE